jgi:hypothetical protein
VRLDLAYSEVGDRTWRTPDFLESNLESSRALYTPESLAVRQPRPKALEVYALLAGLPFEAAFTSRIADVQRQITEVLGGRLHYWVAPANLGVEYCVFKWPAEVWIEARLPVIRDVLAATRGRAFRFDIRGVQINPDGCVIAKGFDEDARLFAMREHVKTSVDFLPKRQSGWAHVPLGRILEPIGAEAFAMLRELMRSLSARPIATTRIDVMKLVHETRWYMEEKTILNEYSLGESSQGSRS